MKTISALDMQRLEWRMRQTAKRASDDGIGVGSADEAYVPPPTAPTLAERLQHIPAYVKPILLVGGATALGVGVGHGLSSAALHGLERAPGVRNYLAEIPPDVLARRLRTIGHVAGAGAGLLGATRTILGSDYIHRQAQRSIVPPGAPDTSQGSDTPSGAPMPTQDRDA